MFDVVERDLDRYLAREEEDERRERWIEQEEERLDAEFGPGWREFVDGPCWEDCDHEDFDAGEYDDYQDEGFFGS